MIRQKEKYNLRRFFDARIWIGAAVLALMLGDGSPVLGADVVREGIQIGALGSLRESLPGVENRYGIKYDIKNFSDSTAALLALDQGQLEVANTTSQHLVRSIDEGMDVVWVMGWGGGYNVLVAEKSLNLKTDDWSALKADVAKRKAAGNPIKIGVPTGSLQHAALIYVLKAHGINPDKDVDIVNIPFPTHPRALSGHEVDMAMTLSVFGALAINKGDATLFDHPLNTLAGKQEIGFIINRKLIKENPRLVQRIVNSHVAAMKEFVGNIDKQIALEEQYTHLPAPVVAMQQRTMLQYDYRTRVDDIKGMAKEMYELGWAKKDYSNEIEKHIDFTFLEKATRQTKAQLSNW